MDFSTTKSDLISDHLMAVNKQLSVKGVDIGAMAIFLLPDINLQPWMLSHQANIFGCTLWSRPGLFEPTLFVMHDVSLALTKKVA
ncbi:hypothetical protein K492DRAFT_178422 [Lichtheimia hyalospora FSU 10163]|nr:hypothetical protein K492DRAFT_178422 [Lichtheimia hyalospora FSU 10163]